MTTQNSIFALFFSVAIVMIGCSGPNTETGTNSEAVQKASTKEKNLILDFNTIKGKTLTEVEKVLGKAENIVKVKGYPCKNTGCQKVFFKNGVYEIFFKLNKVDRVIINKTPNLTNDDNAIATLGLTGGEPSFKNPGIVIRWQSVDNIKEIDFFTDYILIQVTNPD